MLTNNYVILT